MRRLVLFSDCAMDADGTIGPGRMNGLGLAIGIVPSSCS